jgi:hypothetical protein
MQRSRSAQRPGVRGVDVGGYFGSSGIQQVPKRGDLIIGQENSTELGRYTDVARFQTTGAADAQPLSLLLDVRLSHMGPLGFVLSGIEQIDGVNYAQSWYCRPA